MAFSQQGSYKIKLPLHFCDGMEIRIFSSFELLNPFTMQNYSSEKYDVG